MLWCYAVGQATTDSGTGSVYHPQYSSFSLLARDLQHEDQQSHGPLSSLGGFNTPHTTPRCHDDPASLPSGRLEKTTRSSPHHMAQHHPTGSETSPPYAARSSRFGSKPPSVEDDVDVWCYAIVSWMPETTTTIPPPRSVFSPVFSKYSNVGHHLKLILAWQ